jgi:hypothetical protein
MIPAEFRPIYGIPAEIPRKNRRKIAGIPAISMERSGTVLYFLNEIVRRKFSQNKTLFSLKADFYIKSKMKKNWCDMEKRL